MGLLSLWMLIQLVIVLALLGAGLYTLFCLSRASRSLERLADTAERMLAQQQERVLPGARPAAPMTLPNTGPQPSVGVPVVVGPAVPAPAVAVPTVGEVAPPSSFVPSPAPGPALPGEEG